MPFSPDEYKIELTPIDRLIAKLRGPEPKWWYFGDCGRCAIEVAHRLLQTPKLGTFHLELGTESGMLFAVKMGMHIEACHAIFTPPSYGRSYRSVRPRHVAAALEHYKLTGEAKSPFEFVAETRAP